MGCDAIDHKLLQHDAQFLLTKQIEMNNAKAFENILQRFKEINIKFENNAEK